MLGKGAAMVLNRGSGLFKMVTFEQIPEEGMSFSHVGTSGKRVLQAKEISTKAQRWEHIWGIQETARRPM